MEELEKPDEYEKPRRTKDRLASALKKANAVIEHQDSDWEGYGTISDDSMWEDDATVFEDEDKGTDGCPFGLLKKVALKHADRMIVAATNLFYKSLL